MSKVLKTIEDDVESFSVISLTEASQKTTSKPICYWKVFMSSMIMNRLKNINWILLFIPVGSLIRLKNTIYPTQGFG